MDQPGLFHRTAIALEDTRQTDVHIRQNTIVALTRRNDRIETVVLVTKFSHYHSGREQLQPLRDRGPDMDLHPRAASREGTPLDSWSMERGGKLPLMPSVPSHGHGSSRGGGHRGGSNSSGSLRGAGAEYQENGPSNGGGPSGGWEPKSGHLSAGIGSGPGLGQSGGHREGPPPPREGGREVTGRDTARDAGARDPRDAGKIGYRSASLPSGVQQQSTRDGQGRLEGGLARDGSFSGRDRDRDRERDRDRDRERDRERDKGTTATVSFSHAARSSSQGVPAPSPGQSPRRTGSDMATGQGAGAGGSGEVQQAPPVVPDRGREGIISVVELPQQQHQQAQQQLRWGSGTSSAIQHQQQPSSSPQQQQQQTGLGRCVSSGTAAPSASAGGASEAMAAAGVVGGAAAGPSPGATMEVERRASNTSMELDRRYSSGTAPGSGRLDRKPSGSSSQGQAPGLDAVTQLARVSTAGTAPFPLDRPTAAAVTPSPAARAPASAPAAASTQPPTSPVDVKGAESADRRPNRSSKPAHAGASCASAAAAAPSLAVAAVPPSASPSAVVMAPPSAVAVAPSESRPSSTAGAGSDGGAGAAPGIPAVASVNSLSTADTQAGAPVATGRAASVSAPEAEPGELPGDGQTQAARAPSLQPMGPTASPSAQAPSAAPSQPLATVCGPRVPASIATQPQAVQVPSPPSAAAAQPPLHPTQQEPVQQQRPAEESVPSTTPVSGVIAGAAGAVDAVTGPSSSASEAPFARLSCSGGQTSEHPPAATLSTMPGPRGLGGSTAQPAPHGSGAAAGAGEDALLPEKRSSLSIRRFGFGRARRSMPAKSAGEGGAPEDGEVPGGAVSLERAPSGAGRPQPPGEVVDPEVPGTILAAGTAGGKESYAALPPSLVVPEPAGAPPTAAAGVAAAVSTPMSVPGMTTGGFLPTPIPAALTPGGACMPHVGGFTPHYGTATSYSQLTSPVAGPMATPSAAAATTPAATAAATMSIGVALATRSSSSAPSGSGAGAAATGNCAPMEVDSHNAAASQDVVHKMQQQQQPQQSSADAAGSSRNPAETLAGLSLRIEHLETEITDLERQLAALASESRQAQIDAAELAAEVGALEEQLLEDSSSDGGDSDENISGAPGESKSSQPVAEGDADANGVDRSGGSASSANGECGREGLATAAPVMTAQTPVQEVPGSHHQAATTTADGNSAGIQPAQGDGDGATQMDTEAEGLTEAAEDDGDDAAMSTKSQDADEAAAAASSIKPRGRPRSTAKMRAAEAAAAAAAAADSRRKALELQSRNPADGLLHLPAQHFKPRYMDATRRGVSAAQEEVLRLLPDSLAARVRSVVEAATAQQARLASTAPAPGHGRWAVLVPLVPVQVEPLYQEPQDIPAFHANNQRHAAIRDAVGRYLRQRRQLVAAKHSVLVEQYARNMATYKQYIQTEGRRPPAPPPPLSTTGRGASGAPSYGMYGASRAVSSYNPYSYSHSDVIRSDLDEHRLLNNFLAVEQLKRMCALPDMVLDPWERRWRAYDNRNGLVQDPVRELEEERMIKSWAEEERTLFMDKFLQHPKDFRKISTYLPGRSPGDCVAFFYKNQKLDDFSTVRRKQQLKKRRLQADMRKQQYAPLLMAPMIARQRASMGAGAGDVGVRGVRGRASTRGGPPGRGRSSNTLDTDHSMGMGPLSYGGNPGPAALAMSLGGPRGVPSSGGMPGLQSMIAAAQRAAAPSMSLDPRDIITSPRLPPISSNATAAYGAGVSGGSGWTDEDFVECYRQHGKCWEAYCRVLGMRTESAAKQYYYRHKERLGLDRVSATGGPSGGGGSGGADATGVGASNAAATGGMAAVPTASAGGPSHKAFLAARLANEESAAPGLLAAATAAAAMANAAAAAAAAAANAGPGSSAAAMEELAPPSRAVAEASPLRTEDAAVAGLGLLAAVSGRESESQYPSPSPPPQPPPQAQAPVDVPSLQTQVQTQVPVQVLEQARAQAQAEAQAAAQALTQVQVQQVLEQVRVQAVAGGEVQAAPPSVQQPEQQTQPPQAPVMLIPRHPGGRRRGPPRVPANPASLSNGPHASASSLESNEMLRHDGRYKQDLDPDTRSDSEYDPSGAGGAGGVDALQPQLDLLAALRNPVGNPLSQLLVGGLLQPGGGAATAPGGSGGSSTAAAGGGGVKGGKGAAAGSNATVGSGASGGLLGQLLLQQREQQQREQQQQQQREVRDPQPAQGPGALGTLTAAGLNLGMLGSLAGVLQGGMGNGGGSSGAAAAMGLLAGQSAASQADDLSGGQFPSPGEDGPGGAGSGGGAGTAPSSSRRSVNYWSDDERKTFLQVFQMHGRDWLRLADAIPTKSTNQIKTFYHNYKTKLGLDKMELPPSATQPAARRGQGARAIRDTAAAANAATVAAVTGGGNRGFDDPYGDEDHPRPAKRQATGAGVGTSQSSGLELGTLAGDVSSPRGDGSGGGTSPVLPPVMDLQALAHVYGGGGGGGSGGAQASSQHLFRRDHRDHDLAGLTGTGPAGAAAINAPASASALIQLLSSLSELQGAPASGGASGVQALGGRESDEGLGLGRGALGALGGPMQLHGINLPTGGGGGGASSASNLFSTAGQVSPQQQQQSQQQAPVKLQTLNLESLFVPVDRERDRDRDRDRDREQRDRGVGGGSCGPGGGMLQDVGLSAFAQQLQLQALLERSERGNQLREHEQPPPPAHAAPPSQPQHRGISQQEAPLSPEGLTATVAELLASIVQQNQQSQQSQYAVGGGGGGGGPAAAQPTSQALDLAAPSHALTLALDVPTSGSSATPSGLLTALVEATTGGTAGLGTAGLGGVGGAGGTGDMAAALAAAAAAAVAGGGGGARAARASGEAGPGGGGGAPLSLHMLLPRELWADRQGDVKTQSDVGFNDNAGEPAPKRQKRVSKDVQQQQQLSPQGLDLGLPSGLAVGGRTGGDSGCAGRLLLGEEQVTQLLHLQQQQAAKVKPVGTAGLRSVGYQQVRESRGREQQQRSAPQAANPVLNLGSLAGGLQVLPGAGGGNAGGGGGGGGGGCSGGSGSVLGPNLLRLMPLQSAPASTQQQQQQQQQEAGNGGGNGGVPRIPLGASLPSQVMVGTQGQAVTIADLISSLGGGRGLVAQGQGGGMFGLAGGSFASLERLLASSQEAGLGGSSAGAQYISLHPSTAAAGTGTWLGSTFGDQLASLGPRATLNLSLLLQQQQQQQPGDK
ncbi:hypothetical protein VOLCADRAFT_127385 [Volvox carteri f. nagariensis]|uniref:SANT domain-containing protein n=1 Tax=Volvox carteri f. nagariensis TaxID=3068 RepID=D8THU5_VOLCA|nr:uncharacterized protein VOLCADRAFT_127385 [Volvox carteri f. nagariensis]EFJ53127.1 hypothetical protein VOLCADRAFT_127385 [Volvox carteri f. nagariensis]|eukprot:XP_002946132.1 hypothetical protein VOLCADRAFT_127385 [Volvox carteri f. nagariensis]